MQNDPQFQVWENTSIEQQDHKLPLSSTIAPFLDPPLEVNPTLVIPQVHHLLRHLATELIRINLLLPLSSFSEVGIELLFYLPTKLGYVPLFFTQR